MCTSRVQKTSSRGAVFASHGSHENHGGSSSSSSSHDNSSHAKDDSHGTRSSGGGNTSEQTSIKRPTAITQDGSTVQSNSSSGAATSAVKAAAVSLSVDDSNVGSSAKDTKDDISPSQSDNGGLSEVSNSAASSNSTSVRPLIDGGGRDGGYR